MDSKDAKRIANEMWKTGTKCVSKQNFDYAVEAFSMVAMMVPDNLVYRQSLRGAEYLYYNNSGRGA